MGVGENRSFCALGVVVVAAVALNDEFINENNDNDNDDNENCGV
jgi:hypothetical protein